MPHAYYIFIVAVTSAESSFVFLPGLYLYHIVNIRIDNDPAIYYSPGLRPEPTRSGGARGGPAEH